MGATETREKIKVLIIDDDRKLCRLVQDYLAPMGYEVTPAYSGPEGLDLALNVSFQAVILDVMLPGMDGFEILRRIRAGSDVPVLMLTSRGDETDRIVGLEMGADDYLPKTFSTRELLARLRAVTRRSLRGIPTRPGDEEILTFRELRINTASCQASVARQPLDLTPIEYRLLLGLARAAGRVLSRDRLLEEAAGRDYDVFDRSIDMHISSLRRKLGDDPKSPRYIRTVRGMGYMLIREEPDS